MIRKPQVTHAEVRVLRSNKRWKAVELIIKNITWVKPEATESRDVQKALQNRLAMFRKFHITRWHDYWGRHWGQTRGHKELKMFRVLTASGHTLASVRRSSVRPNQWWKRSRDYQKASDQTLTRVLRKSSRGQFGGREEVEMVRQPHVIRRLNYWCRGHLRGQLKGQEDEVICQDE
jgi:hypothetical protein